MDKKAKAPKKNEKKKEEKKPEAKEEKKPVDPRKIILITGANRGLGFALTEALLEKKAKLRIIMTSRDEAKGKEAYDGLCTKYPDEVEHFFFHQLDIDDEESISTLIEYIKKTYKKFDYLINNAGVSSKGTDFTEEVCDETFKTNVYGTINFTDKLLSSSVFNKSGKIIFVTSISGSLLKITNENLLGKFKNAKTADDLLKLAEKFKKSIGEGKTDEEGWYKNCFAISKLILNFYAKVLIKKREVTKELLSIYAVHPGWIKTDMGGEHAPLEVSEGVNRLMYLIELPDSINKDFQGKLFDENKVFNYEGETKADDKGKGKAKAKKK